MVQENDGGFDLFGFDDGLGIKILDEVFLCQYCHNQIPQDGVINSIENKFLTNIRQDLKISVQNVKTKTSKDSIFQSLF